jgi:hypothetical protein
VAAVRDAGSPIDRRQLSGSAGDQGTANKKPNKVTGGQNAGAVNNGGSAATGQPGMTAAVTTGGHAAKVDLAANTAKQPAQATSQKTPVTSYHRPMSKQTMAWPLWVSLCWAP